MKKIYFLSLFAFINCASLQNVYIPPSHARTSGGSSTFLTAPFGSSPTSRHFAGSRGQEADAQIRSFTNNNDGNGYQFAYETSNGISAQEHGQSRVAGPEGTAIASQGYFQYTSPEGESFKVEYIADENGFQPKGNHLPTPPPIPEAILKSLQFNRNNPSGNGFSDKGQSYTSSGFNRNGGFHTQSNFGSQSGYRY